MNTQYLSTSRQVGSSDKDQQAFIIFVSDISMIKNTISDPLVFFLEMQRTTKVEFPTRVNPIISYCLICTHYCRTLLKMCEIAVFILSLCIRCINSAGN